MELIDRRKLVSDFWRGVEDGAILSFEDTDELMEKAPTVDAVEVVRCKDCLYCLHDVHGLWCFRDYENNLQPDDYCSHGERKDND